jgi:hypothetical protein
LPDAGDAPASETLHPFRLMPGDFGSGLFYEDGKRRGGKTLADDDDTGLGGKFWLMVIGATIALGIGALILFAFVDIIWYAWGFFGALLFVFLVIGVIGWIMDRRAQQRYDRLPAG